MDYYGFSLGVDVLPGSVFLNVFFTGAIELPSYVMTCILLNKVEYSLDLVLDIVKQLISRNVKRHFI